LNPRHAAVSLDGEPTLYPRITELIHEYSRKGFTTFLVTNGSNPKALNSLENDVTQLYLSLYAPDEKTFKSLCEPVNIKAWHNIRESLQFVKNFTRPTVVRLTLVKGFNMEKPTQYVKLLSEVEPTYIEAKAYMYVGYSRHRLTFDAMPNFNEITRFAETLADEIGYRVITSSADSRVVLISRLKTPQRLR